MSDSTDLFQSQFQQALMQPAMDFYSPLADVYDEALLPTGAAREHWGPTLTSLKGLGRDNLAARESKTQRILRDDGATYKSYTDRERTWNLDTVPLIIDSDRWGLIEAGISQRSELFNRLFNDIYGPQELIRQGIIPPEVVFSHPGFLRPCFGIKQPAEHALILHGVDLVRTSEDNICVIADRTQAPSGAGYALENRTVMSRVFPDLFRQSQVQRLATFFQTLRVKLNNLSPDDHLPNIVVLTPGSSSESYFEHAYLANYLGYSLVQGRDLTVRNGYVWMKSLSGLSRVDVILRRVDDFYCDPAELKSDSYLGVPGLLEVIRGGKIVLANPLGSGILESPLFLKYLPVISQALLGEQLLLPSVKTWWANDPVDRDYMLTNLSSLLIKLVYQKKGQKNILGSQLSAAQLIELREKIRQTPLKYVAQAVIAPSHVPTWQQHKFSPKPVIFTSFCVAGDKAYSVMPGGLTRVDQTVEYPLASNGELALSKDTWVLSKDSVRHLSLRSDKLKHESMADDQEQNLSSRIVENMFWLGRYAIRAEYALRLLRTIFLQLNNADQLSEKSYQIILLTVTEVTETFPGFTTNDKDSNIETALFKNPEAELMSVITDRQRRGSVVANLNEMLNCAEEVKSFLSADTQRVVNDIRDNVNALEQTIKADFGSAPEEALDPLVTSLLALSGLVNESMIRGYGWRFIEIGRDLERAYQTTKLVNSLMSPVLTEYDEDAALETVLLTLETLVTYRRRYRDRSGVVNGLELTLLDETNPRSLNSLLQSLKAHVDVLPSRQLGHLMSVEKRLSLELLTKVQLATPVVLGKVIKGVERRQNLFKLMKKSQHLLNQLAIVLSDTYFDHTEIQHQVMAASWEDEL
ncbi:MAG: putative circularly permuted ATP-grasp superfamily protein [Pseudohongiellaceae bacterium]|jgi:uncharacterized circularly permuted ATP-grasp superfamily protein/uncharacterized alpha-E superfamily protein